MFSKRICAIASLVDKDKSVIDIGTDHAYLPIYLIKNNITNRVDASDISKKVLEISLENLSKFDYSENVGLYLSDGFKDINKEYDIAVIAGMGTSTIKSIINNAKVLPDKLIIQSNNQLDELRLFMQNIGYKIDQEIAIKDKNIYYVIIKYIKGKENLTEEEILFGKNNNIEYLNYLLDKYKYINNKINNGLYNNRILILKKVIEKIQD